MFYVYALVDPFNKLPFYIGKGSGKRHQDHMKEKFNPKSLKSRFVHNIRAAGKEPQVSIMMYTECEDTAFEYEYDLIQYCKLLQIPLTNIVGYLRNNHATGRKWPAERIARRSETVRRTGCQRGKIISAEQRIQMSLANKGKEGPNKAYVDLDLLRELYLEQNLTKKEVRERLNIGPGSLNRILQENQIIKIVNRRWHC